MWAALLELLGSWAGAVLGSELGRCWQEQGCIGALAQGHPRCAIVCAVPHVCLCCACIVCCHVRSCPSQIAVWVSSIVCWSFEPGLNNWFGPSAWGIALKPKTMAHRISAVLWWLLDAAGWAAFWATPLLLPGLNVASTQYSSGGCWPL